MQTGKYCFDQILLFSTSCDQLVIEWPENFVGWNRIFWCCIKHIQITKPVNLRFWFHYWLEIIFNIFYVWLIPRNLCRIISYAALVMRFLTFIWWSISAFRLFDSSWNPCIIRCSFLMLLSILCMLLRTKINTQGLFTKTLALVFRIRS